LPIFAHSGPSNLRLAFWLKVPEFLTAAL